MDPETLTPKSWYWIRRGDGSLAPYVFHRVREDEATGRVVAEFFVGSFLQSFQLNQIVGEARMPKREAGAAE